MMSPGLTLPPEAGAWPGGVKALTYFFTLSAMLRALPLLSGVPDKACSPASRPCSLTCRKTVKAGVS